MAVAEIIGTAIGTMLIIIVAYLLVGNVLNTAQVVSDAQKDMTLLSESRLHTDLSITGVTASGNVINLTVTNTGSETISDFNHTDVLVYTTGGTGYTDFLYDPANSGVPYSWGGSIINAYVHPGELDPGESMYVNVYYPVSAPVSFGIGICTNNGVYVSTII
jgi:flagellar protein FlaF